MSNSLVALSTAWRSKATTFTFYHLTPESARLWHDRIRGIRDQRLRDKELLGSLWRASFDVYQESGIRHALSTSSSDLDKFSKKLKNLLQYIRHTDEEILLDPQIITTRDRNLLTSLDGEALVVDQSVNFQTLLMSGNIDTVGTLDLSTILCARLYFSGPNEREDLLDELAEYHPEAVLDIVETGLPIFEIAPKKKKLINTLPQTIFTKLLQSDNCDIRLRTIRMTDCVESSQKLTKNHKTRKN